MRRSQGFGPNSDRASKGNGQEAPGHPAVLPAPSSRPLATVQSVFGKALEMFTQPRLFSLRVFIRAAALAWPCASPGTLFRSCFLFVSLFFQGQVLSQLTFFFFFFESLAVFA